MRRVILSMLASGALCLASAAGAQDLGDRFKQFVGAIDGSRNDSVHQLPQSDVVAALKASLADGAAAAVTELGRTDGFWGNSARRIPLPGWLDNASGVLRSAGLGEQMDGLQLSLNRAAEQATAEAGPIVRETINAMSVGDAYDILQGSDTAATDYLRAHAGDQLAAKFEPIIARTTAQSQAVSRYQALTSRARPMLSFVPGVNLDLNDYVTQQALDGLFAVIGQQEARLRANPGAASSALLRRVFGAASG